MSNAADSLRPGACRLGPDLAPLGDPETLLEEALRQQRAAWLAGRRTPAADWLRAFPDLADPDQAAELIYHDVALRREWGESPDWKEYLRQFPEYAVALQMLRRADEILEQAIHAPEPLLSQVEIDDYELLGEVGRGGMGVVYKARQKSLDRIVALKMIRMGEDAAEAERKRFHAEARVVACMHHPNIVQIYEVGEANGRLFLTLEYVEGQSLASRLDGFPWPARRAAALVETLARAMQYAHGKQIIHRDLKPANILLVSEGEVHGDWSEDHAPRTPKITDFGLAKRLDRTAHSQSGTVLGTPSYMAPEQAQMKPGIDARTDVYGLGAVLFELLTGRPPFRADSALQILQQVVEAEPVRPRLLNPSVPRDLETVCLKCLEKEPARRYATAEELADDLRRFCEGRPVVARPVSRPERLRRWARRNPLPATLAAGLALAVTAGLATALALWWNAERHLREEEIARRESEDNYLTCRQLLGEFVAVTRDLRLHNPAGLGNSFSAGPDERPWSAHRRREQREALAKARAFCEGLAQRRPDDLAVQRVLAEICTGLATLDAHDGRLEEARQAGETARTLWQALGTAASDTEGRDRLAGVLSTLGFVYGHLCRNLEAAASLRQALALWDQREGDGAESTSALLAGCAARRELRWRLLELGDGYRPEQLRMFEESCSRLERAIGGGGGLPELRLELLVNLTLLGEGYQHNLNRVDGDRCWRRGYELGRRLIDEMPDSGSVVYHLARCGCELAARDRAAAPPEETARLCCQAARLLEAQRLRDPSDRDCTETLANVCWMLADSSIQAGQRAEALRAARRAAAVLTELADRHPDDPVVRLHVFQGQARLAVREGQCGESSAARHSARQAADGLEVFCEAGSANPQSLALAVRMGDNLAPSLRHAGMPDQVMRVVQYCLRTSERLVREFPDVPDYQAGLSQAWFQVGKAHSSAQCYEQAEAAFRASAQVADRLAERWPEYRPMHEERLRRLRRFLEERREAAAAARAQAKE